MAHDLTVHLVGGPTAILEYGGLRWMTDPAFDPPGDHGGLVKLAGPSVPLDDVGEIDAVLLSHDQHADNLDDAGRAFLPRAGRVLTTVAGAERLGGNAVGVEPWASAEVGDVTVTAVPARHGPEGSEPVTGPVIGFYLTGEAVPSLYVSGDNASVDVVRTIVDRLGPPELAVLFAGGARLPHRFDGAYLTLSSEDAAEAARVLGSRAIVPVHFHGWQHFSNDGESLRAAFEAAGLSDRLVFAEPGETVSA